MFRVIDRIVGEEIICKNQYSALVEAERRLSIHQAGYTVRRIHIPPIACHLETDGEDYIICLD